MKREQKKKKETKNQTGCFPFILVAVVVAMLVFMGKNSVKKDFNYLMRGEADIKGFFYEVKDAYEKNMTYPDFILPLSGNITSPFGKRIHPIRNTEELHTGIDIDVNNGTDVKASEDGEIIKQSFDERFGNYIIIKHKGSFFTCYAHLESFIKKEGDFVQKEESIGVAGQTGEVTGPHLHFEIRKGEERLDPQKYLSESES